MPHTKLFAAVFAATFTALTVAENRRLWKRNTELGEKLDIAITGFVGLLDENATLDEKATLLFNKCQENDVEFDAFEYLVLTHDLPQE